ncbi:unnamed protein product [Blepharisma stoltei]|uniref:Cyclic nucleotide-binding domain-containing protein n=1 Tax=Blepharisma stoltei TaxID=1481888 RepID=A0AAU9JYD6_9CILI|nr:unnamed protein product [Blepharisma stoltei]
MHNVLHKYHALSIAQENTEINSTSPAYTINKETDFRNQDYESYPVEYSSERTKFLWNRIRHIVLIVARLNLMSKDIQTYGVTRKYFGNVEEDLFTQTMPKFLFHPYGQFKLYWNFIMLLLMLYTGFVTPYITCFIDSVSTALFYTEISVNFVFFLDTIFTFNSAYFDQVEMLVVSRKEIAKNYIKSWFIIDVISFIPFDLLSGSSSTGISNLVKVSRLYKIFRLFRLVKMMRFAKSKAFFEEFVDKLKLSSGMVRMFKFMFIVLVAVHITGCLWYYLGKLENFSYDSWVVKANLIDKSYFEKYIASIYFAFATVTTVGYGDIHPITNKEKIFAMMLMGFGVTFFSHMIGNIQNILSQKDSSELSLRTRLQSLQEFARIAKIPIPLRQRIKKNIMRTHYQNISRWSDQENLLKSIPARLRVEISSHLNTKLVERIYFLKDKEQLFLSFVVPKLKTAHLLFKEFVYRENDYAEEMYFLDMGRVHVKALNGVTFWTYSSGAYFGEVELIDETSREGTVQVASRTIDLLILSKPDFLKMMKNFPNEEDEIKETAAVRKLKLESAKSHVLELALPQMTLDINRERLSIDASPIFDKRDTGNELGIETFSTMEKKSLLKLWSDAIKGKNVKEKWIYQQTSYTGTITPSSFSFSKKCFSFKNIKKKKTKLEWLNEQGIEEILHNGNNNHLENAPKINDSEISIEEITNQYKKPDPLAKMNNLSNNQLLIMQSIDSLIELLKIGHGS